MAPTNVNAQTGHAHHGMALPPIPAGMMAATAMALNPTPRTNAGRLLVGGITRSTQAAADDPGDDHHGQRAYRTSHGGRDAGR